MPAARDIFFAPFRLDLIEGKLWNGAAELGIRPKTFAVLRHLAENAGRLVTAGDLVHAVWADSHGSEALVKGCVRELRRLLGDEAAAPRYVETVGRRGYRFIAPAETTSRMLASVVAGCSPAFVGRQPELERLEGWLAKALAGERQIVLLSGEPGIGKTTLAERFLEAAEARHAVRIARGRCVELYGPGEPYLPVLEALGRLCRGPGGDRVLAVVERYAPTWLAQLPALLSDPARTAIQLRGEAAGRHRMLREMCEAAAALATERPLIVWLDDLQWSDPSTVDLISSLAVHTEPARLLLLAAYRPADVVVSQHPLGAVRRELRARNLCHDLPLPALSAVDVERYLAVRFPENELPATLGTTLLGVTDGSPLFLTALLDELVTRGSLSAPDGRWQLRGGLGALDGAEPENLRHLIEQQVERLAEDDQRLLEAASVAGGEFSAGAVAAALGIDADRVDARLEAVSQCVQLVEPVGLDASPRRPASGRYAFVHTLYQKFLYARLPFSRKARLHRLLGAAQEAAWGDQCGDVAAELAQHFERGRDAERAARYLTLAGENAVRRHAYTEAVDLFSRALDALTRVAAGPERNRRELAVLVATGPPLMIVRGYGASEVGRVYGRAAALCERLSRPTADVFATLCGLWRFHYTRGDLARARVLAARALRIALGGKDPAFRPVARMAMGCTLFYLGSFGESRKHLEKGLASHERHPARRWVPAHDPGVSCLAYLGVVLWFLGYPDQALAASRRSLALARQIDDPFSLSYALTMACMVPVARAEVKETLALTASAHEVTSDDRFPGLSGWSAFVDGWARGEAGDYDGGIARMRESLAMLDRLGARTSKTFLYTLLASVYSRADRPADGIEALDEGLALGRVTGERFLEAELLRRRSELQLVLAARDPRGEARLTAQAERGLRTALAIARRRKARSLELRAAMSVARLLRRRDRTSAARKLLEAPLAWFTEGFESRDLREARALLAELERA